MNASMATEVTMDSDVNRETSIMRWPAVQLLKWTLPWILVLNGNIVRKNIYSH